MASTASEVCGTMKANKIGGLDRWDVEQDLRALRDVSKLQSDTKRMKAVQTLVKEEMGALKKLAKKDDNGLGVEVV